MDSWVRASVSVLLEAQEVGFQAYSMTDEAISFCSRAVYWDASKFHLNRNKIQV